MTTTTTTTTTTKAAYTTEQTTALVAAYTANPTSETVEAFALTFGKTTKSIIAKLSREGCYVKKTTVRKDGTKVEKKDQTADAIGLILGLSESDTSSLSKANRSALQAIFKALAESKPL